MSDHLEWINELPRLEASCAGFDTYSLDFGLAKVNGTLPPVDGDTRAFCPRREVLDARLVKTAEFVPTT